MTIPKRGSILVASVLALAIAVLPRAAGAAAGDLDPSFGVGGKVVTDFGGTDEARAVVLQPNGKIVVGGAAAANGRNHFALARYLPDGSLDPIFDGDGKVTTDFGAGAGIAALASPPAAESLPPVGRPADSPLRATGGTEASTRRLARAAR